MGIRETLNKHRGIATGVALAVTLVAGFFAIREVGAELDPPLFDEAYYTADDGKSWFTDKKNKLPPFSTSSGQAVRVIVYEKDGKPLPLYLERYTEETRAAIEAFEADKAANRQPKRMDLVMGADASGTEVKRPGETKWVLKTSKEGREITTAPEGAVPIEPQ